MWEAIVTLKNTFLDVEYLSEKNTIPLVQEDTGNQCQGMRRSSSLPCGLQREGCQKLFLMKNKLVTENAGCQHVDGTVSEPSAQSPVLRPPVLLGAEKKFGPEMTRGEASEWPHHFDMSFLRALDEDEESNANEDASDYWQPDGGPKPSRSKLRPCKGKRNRLRKLMLRMLEQGLRNPAEFDVRAFRLPPSVAASEFLQRKLFNKVQTAMVEIMSAAQEARMQGAVYARQAQQGQADAALF